LHPVIPFVTDELWTALTGGSTVMAAAWPGGPAAGGPAAGVRDAAAEAEIGSLMRLVTEVRRFRSDQGLRPGQPVPALLSGLAGTRLAGHEASIRALLRLTEPGGSFTATASLQAEGVTVELGAAGVDVAAQRRRLEKDLAAAQKEAEQTERKLGNESFLAKAPAEVVARTRERLAAARADIDRISARLAGLHTRAGT
ncbi:MAG: class I tRNA ligase family protein, partial [Actinobacteria bacterium]|nr:class I tRNA ligase family protein [Actinomycetota bacterium]